MSHTKQVQFAAARDIPAKYARTGEDATVTGVPGDYYGVAPFLNKHLLQALRLSSFQVSQNKQVHPSNYATDCLPVLSRLIVGDNALVGDNSVFLLSFYRINLF